MENSPASSMFTILSEPEASGHTSTLSSRIDSSLNVITKKFVDLLKDAPGMELDLNYAASLLEIHKRRLYDITNVLEGVGCIKKKSKNNVQYLGDSFAKLNLEGLECAACGGAMHSPEDELFSAIGKLMAEEKEIDSRICAVNEELRQLSQEDANVDLAYVTYADLKNLGSIPAESLFAVKTPPGTLLDLPASSSPGGEALLTLTAPEGRIDVFYIQDALEGTL